MELERTPFDNNRTLLYKWAYNKSVPVRLVIILKRPPGEPVRNLEPEDQVFITLKDRIKSMPDSDYFSETVYPTVKNGIQNNLKDLDILMTWYERMIEAGHKPEDLIDELNEWNERRVGKNRELYANVDKLISSYEGWTGQIEASLIRDNRYTEDIILTAEEELNQYEPVKLTGLTVKSSTLSLNAKNRDGSEIAAEDSTDIFDASQVTPEIPFISYLENEELEKYLNKIYVSPLERAVDLDRLIIRRGVLKTDNVIYLNVYKFLGNIDLSSVQPNYFTRSELNLTSKELSINSTPETESVLLSRVKNALPNVSLSEMKETYITGVFYVFGVNLFLPSFLDILLREPLFRLYLYVDEVGQPQALKQRLNIKYRSGAFVESEETETKVEDRFSISIRSVVAGQELTFDLLDSGESPKKYTVKAQEPYLTLTINRASSHSIIQEFLRIFRYLLGAYNVKRYEKPRFRNAEGKMITQPSIEEIYSNLFPLLAQQPEPFSPFSISESESVEEEGMERKRSEQLAVDAPEIFQRIPSYGSKCQSRAQPFVLQPEEVPDWTSQTFSYKGQVFIRQALSFPPKVTTGTQPLPEKFFGCDSSDYPFPGIRAVKKEGETTSEELPYVPCCYQSDQMDPNNIGSDYNIYYKGYEKPSETEKASKLISRVLGKRQILNPYRLGYIPFDLENLLKKYVPESEWLDSNRRMTRMGVPLSTSSLLHCVCESVSDPDYIGRPIEEREPYIQELRRDLPKRVPLHVARQELWDLSDQEILTRINDPNVFFDPLLFYRLVEEYFNVNIYTFGFVDDAVTRIEIPRHKVFHASVYRGERPTILIMRHRGTIRETKNIPQCELIVDANSKSLTAVKIFPTEMTSIVNTIFTLNNNVITFSFDNSIRLVGRNRLYYRLDFRQLVGGGTSCWIDAYGKMRAIVFLHNGRPITLAGIPSQPENLPLIESVAKLPNATFRDAIEVLGEPIGVTKDSIGQIIGFWYPIFDIPFGVYIPVMQDLTDPKELESRLQQLAPGPPPPLNVASGPALERLRYLRKLASIIQQLAEYLFDIYRSNKIISKEPINVPEFTKTYFGSINRTGDPLEYYNIRNIPRVLPKEISVDSAISKMSQLMPRFFTRDKFILYNVELLKKVSTYVANYYKETEGLDLQPKSKLNIFLDEEDFNQTKNSNVFLTEKDLLLWITSQKVVSVNLTIVSKLDPSKAQALTPYLYQHSNGQIYLIQNVVINGFKRALKVAGNWSEGRINLGAGRSNEEIDDKEIAFLYVVYGISPSGVLTVIRDESEVGQPYLEIIYYGTNLETDTAPRYGALLPLLK